MKESTNARKRNSLDADDKNNFSSNELKNKNIPFLVVLTNPTTGGVTASWASLGDILIAEPKDQL